MKKVRQNNTYHKLKKKQFYFNHAVLNAQKNKKKRIELITKIIDSGIYLNGPQARLLQKKLTNFLDVPYVTTTASGHDALLIALSSLRLTKDDEVIFPVNATPTAFPVHLSSAKPIPADVDVNGQLNPQEVEKKITKKTKAIIMVHLYGNVGNLDEICALAKKHKIFFIEDCAQSFGTRWKGKMTGTFSDISCFSFYPTKNLATLGDGGAIATKNKRLHEFFQKAKSYGEKKRYWSEFVAGHSRLPEIQAGILNLYFETIEKELEKRRKLRLFYMTSLERMNLSRYLTPLLAHNKSTPALHLFVVCAKKREGFIKYLKGHSIESYIHYPYPIHLLPAFSSLGLKKGSFPVAEKLSQEIVSLPFHPSLSQKDIQAILQKIKNFYFGKQTRRFLAKYIPPIYTKLSV